MAPGLRLQAVHRIHQQYCNVRGAGGGDHVARVLLVSGCVADDELALRCGEIAVCDVDGDALFALGQKSVGDEREVDRHLSRAARSGLECCHLVGQETLAVPKQATDQRALAVVDAPCGGEAQWRSSHCGNGMHQKYPCRLRSSIAASLAWSSSRVAPRSVMRVTAVSFTMSSSVAASDSTGAVQGMSPTVRKRTERFWILSSAAAGVRCVTGTNA